MEIPIHSLMALLEDHPEAEAAVLFTDTLDWSSVSGIGQIDPKHPQHLPVCFWNMRVQALVGLDGLTRIVRDPGLQVATPLGEITGKISGSMTAACVLRHRMTRGATRHADHLPTVVALVGREPSLLSWEPRIWPLPASWAPYRGVLASQFFRALVRGLDAPPGPAETTGGA